MEYAFCSIVLYVEKKKASDCALTVCEHFALYVFYEITMASAARQEEAAPMETTLPPARPGWEHRLHAVLALLGGEPMPQVTARFGIGRSVLYKWRQRALHALQSALTDHRPGPTCPPHRLSPEREQPLVALAQRHPTWRAATVVSLVVV